MIQVRCARYKLVFAAVLAHDRWSQLVHGAQVEVEHLLLFEYLEAELAYLVVPRSLTQKQTKKSE